MCSVFFCLIIYSLFHFAFGLFLQMVRRFRLWESNHAVSGYTEESPSRSMALSGSHSTSFLTSGDTSESRSERLPIPVGFRKRQLIVAVTANSAECEKVNDGGFDEICAKPLTRADIYKVITHFFQYE